MSLKWVYNNKEIGERLSIPHNWIGFVFEYTYDDGSKYVGKRNFWVKFDMPLRKDKQPRPRHIKFYRKPTPKGKYLYRNVEQVFTLSKWRTTVNLPKTTYYRPFRDGRKVIKKEIIAVAKNSYKMLTYLYTKECYIRGVLEDSNYINGNLMVERIKLRHIHIVPKNFTSDEEIKMVLNV